VIAYFLRDRCIVEPLIHLAFVYARWRCGLPPVPACAHHLVLVLQALLPLLLDLGEHSPPCTYRI